MSKSHRAHQAGPLLGAGLLLLAGGLSIATQLLGSANAPSDADWKRAADVVVEQARAEDAIRVEPTWSESAMVHLGPVGNLLHRHHHPQIEDFQGMERVWVIAEAERAEDGAARLPPGSERVSSKQLGEVSLELYALPPELQLGPSLLTRLPEARVEHVSATDENVTPCRRWDARRKRWNCPGGHYVGSELLEVGDDPRRCAWAHALKQGQVLRVSYPADALLEEQDAAGSWLRLRAGVDLRGARHERAQPLTYRVFIGEEQVLSHTLGKFDASWMAHTIDLRALSPEKELRLEVRTDDPEAHGRRFCFNGWVVDDTRAELLRDHSGSVESSSSK
ncbi:hypothetical protein EA187_11220 [Lujinxingia sediminis]|uniref:Glycosyl hydrolase family 98 putative carbohydrate-binding module domain-containing protein n=1 Tax=Lujinxingia sediminis TaxID=2480984 RepID=A0ABY0CSN7_9DELT|nr:hypothetical protein [Lujinxingia sediminis]RVU44113.1 hypothetical protein EA187_11220 [Lujinxingia sediminis]